MTPKERNIIKIYTIFFLLFVERDTGKIFDVLADHPGAIRTETHQLPHAQSETGMHKSIW